MYEHHIDEMVEAVMCSLGYFPPVNEDEKAVQEEEREKIREGLESCWVDKIAVSWSVEDVGSMAKEMGFKLTEKEKLDILNGILHDFDAGVGINWTIIDLAIQRMEMGKGNG